MIKLDGRKMTRQDKMILKKKIENLWAELLETKSVGYLIRAKIEQNLSIVLSNISSSFMGNRQLANHNTDDLKFNLNKIVSSKFEPTHKASKSIELLFLKHRQKLNMRLIANSEDLLSTVEQLQLIHQKIMRTNEEVIRFNSSLLELSTELIGDENTLDQKSVDDETLKDKLNEMEKAVKSSKKKCDKIMAKVDLLFTKNILAQENIQEKRQAIMKNRKLISETRKMIDIFL